MKNLKLHLTKFKKGVDYSIVDDAKNKVIEIYNVKRVDNWYSASVRQLTLTDKLDELFNKVEALIKSRDIKSMLLVEKEIMTCGLKIEETDDTLNEIHLGKKNKVYFKIAEMV